MNNPPSDNHRAGRVMDVVVEALELPPAERAAFVLAACDGDEPLRAEAESLLDHAAGAEGLLAAPVFAPAGGRLFGANPGELQPGDTLGDCRIIRFLGEGGTGEVYLAQDTRLERPVAVKLLKRQFDEGQLLRRFHHERRVLAGLTHPNIARLYGGATTPEGRSYLVMEYIEGERLDRYCDTKGLDVTGRLELFRKVCAAVAYAHQNLVVHRDLKPANIRVTPEGEPKLLDFGIAKLLETEATTPESSPTVTMQAMMTPEYASPEQLRGESITTASDVYSLGVVLYELLTGQRPYTVSGRRPDELARAICEQEPPRPSTVASRGTRTETETGASGETPARLRRRLKGDLDNIVAKALRKEPTRRYASVVAFSDDIHRHCEGLPVSARPDTLRYRAGKFIRRNKTGVTASALVVLALVIGLVTAIQQARVARRERDRAQAALVQAKIAQKQAEQIDDFLQSLLASADPAKLGKDVRMVQVVDAAAVNLDRDLANEPEVLLQAHLTLSRTYRNLQVYEPADQQARAALALVRRLHGAETPITASVEYTLGEILASRHQATEAESLLRHALSIYRAQTPPDRAALAGTLANLGFTLYTQPERAAEAESLFAEALADARAVWGESDPKYVRVLNQYATLTAGKRDYAKAEGMFRQIISLQEQIGQDGAASLPPQINLCVCLFNQEKLAELEIALDHLDVGVQRLVGENSYPYAYAQLAHGALNMMRGESRVAIPYLRKALGPLTSSFAPDSTPVIQCEALMGLCLTRDNQTAEGEKWLRTAFDHSAKVDRADFAHSFGNLETALGECLLAQKRYAEAEPLLLAGYEDLTKRFGGHEPLPQAAARRLHDLYLAWNKPAEAERFAPGGANKDSSRP